MSSFIETDICKSRSHCISCRRDARFRDNFIQKMGAWECPLGIPIDAADDKFPADMIERWKQAQVQMEVHRKRVEEATAAIDELSIVLTGRSLELLEKIRSAYVPQTKIASKCINQVKSIGEVDQVCCGGVVKKVAAYECKKHIVCTDRKCNNCNDFVLKKD